MTLSDSWDLQGIWAQERVIGTAEAFLATR
jgi:hypothetical protein